MSKFSASPWQSKCSPEARQGWGEYSSDCGSSREAHLRDLKTQFVSALLFVLTVAAVCCATINFRQQSLYRLADDGVIWVDRPDSNGRNSVVALHVPSGGEAENAGIRDGDVLLQLAGTAINQATDVAKTLQHIVIWDKPEYLVRRGNVQFPAHVVVGETV